MSKDHAGLVSPDQAYMSGMIWESFNLKGERTLTKGYGGTNIRTLKKLNFRFKDELILSCNLIFRCESSTKITLEINCPDTSRVYNPAGSNLYDSLILELGGYKENEVHETIHNFNQYYLTLKNYLYFTPIIKFNSTVSLSNGGYYATEITATYDIDFTANVGCEVIDVV